MHMLFISISFFMHWLWPPEHFWKEVLRSYILALFPIWGYKNLQYNIKYVLNIPTNPKGNQPWVLIGRTDAEAEAPILWPPDGKSWLVGEDPDAGKDWRQKEKGWQRMRWLESITNSMDMNLSKLQERMKDRGLACCSPWDHRVGHNLVIK